MVVIAIAGGANGLGRTIAETVLRQGKHQVKILEENDVHTVISTMFLTTSAKPQNNLVMAADASKVTKRFAPSIWGVPMARE